MVGEMLRALAVLVALTASAHADPSERSDLHRIYHGIPVIGGAALYVLFEIPLKASITPSECRWCEPNALDSGARDALRWDDVHLANKLSNLTGYLGNPIYAAGALMLTNGGGARRDYDDVVPVMQAGIATGLLNQGLKLVAMRRRPFAQFGATRVRAVVDENTSFFSGHTALAFTMAAASGTVASIRGYESAPFLWIGGGLIAATTGYLRIAGDAHYLTDVLVGALFGTGIGIAVPLLFHYDVLTDETAPVARRASSADQPFMFSLGGAF